MKRRTFLGRTVAGLGLIGSGPARLFANQGSTLEKMPVLAFSKHLQHLDYAEMAKTAAGMGFDGIDLTVRPGGHVEPAHVREQLPAAVEAIRSAGMDPVTMSTEVLRNEHGHDRAVLETAVKSGISQYRIGTTRYEMSGSIEDQFEDWARAVRDLAPLNQHLGILGAVQNHSRFYVGGLIWDLWMAIRETPPGAIGCHFDICHAVAEAAISWPVGFKLFRPRITAIVVKDFQFERRDGANNRRMVPLGTGMVPWEQFWDMVRHSGLRVPIILHMEYGDSPSGEERFLERDLRTLRSMLAGTWQRRS